MLMADQISTIRAVAGHLRRDRVVIAVEMRSRVAEVARPQPSSSRRPARMESERTGLRAIARVDLRLALGELGGAGLVDRGEALVGGERPDLEVEPVEAGRRRVVLRPERGELRLELGEPGLERGRHPERRRRLGQPGPADGIVPRLADRPERVYFGPAGARSPANRSNVSRPKRPR